MHLKGINNFTKEYLPDRLPRLASYHTFNYHQNSIVSAATELSKQLLSSYKSVDCDTDTLIVSSLPMMTCTGKNRTARWLRRLPTRIRLYFLQPLKTTCPYSRWNALHPLKEKPSLLKRYTRIPDIDNGRMSPEATVFLLR